MEACCAQGFGEIPLNRRVHAAAVPRYAERNLFWIAIKKVLSHRHKYAKSIEEKHLMPATRCTLLCAAFHKIAFVSDVVHIIVAAAAIMHI
jgi:hypothetical protein